MDSPHQSFITTKDASKVSGYTSDYLARLVRSKEIVGEKIGRGWFIDQTSLESFIEKQKHHNINRAEELMRLRAEEYRRHTADTKQTRDLPEKPAVVRPVLDLGVGHASLRSRVFALMIALLVVAPGTLLSQVLVVDRVTTIAQAFASGFALTFGDVPAQVVSHIATASAEMSTYSLDSTEHSVLHTATASITVAPFAIAAPRIPTIDTVAVAKPHTDTPTPAAVVGFDPALLPQAFLSMGNTVIEASHAAIRADVAVAYGFAILGPETARTIVTAVGTTGAVLAGAASKAPALAAGLSMRAADAPSYLAPALAQAVFGAEYAVAVRFVAISDAVSERYLALIEDTGNAVYDGTEGALALATAFSHATSSIEYAYLGAINGTALAIDDTAAVVPSPASLLPPTSSVSTGLASVLPAFSAGEKALNAAYETLRALFDSTFPYFQPR
ncbi:MAG: helix-turn-helix domain-containing protein [Candidatus Paceibacteria bacterium]